MSIDDDTARRVRGYADACINALWAAHASQVVGAPQQEIDTWKARAEFWSSCAFEEVKA